MMAALVVWFAGFAAILGLIRIAIGWVAAADSAPRPAPRPVPRIPAPAPALVALAPAAAALAPVPEPLQAVD